MLVLSLHVLALLPLGCIASQALVERTGPAPATQTCTFAKALGPREKPIDSTCGLQFINAGQSFNFVPTNLVPPPDADGTVYFQLDKNCTTVVLSSASVLAFSPKSVNILCTASTNGATSTQIASILAGLAALGLNSQEASDTLTQLLRTNPLLELQCDLELTVSLAKDTNLIGSSHICSYNIPFPYVAVGQGFQACTLPSGWEDVLALSISFFDTKFPVQSTSTALSPIYFMDDFVFTKSQCTGFCN